MQDPGQDPAHLAVLEELRSAAVATFGEDRAAEAPVQAALAATSVALWRVMGVTLMPTEETPDHG